MAEVIRDAEGRPFSKWLPAEKFEFMWRQHGIPGRRSGKGIHVRRKPQVAI